MSIITISRGSYSKGKEIAEKLAEKLGYKCISRDVLLEASSHFNIPEVKLVRALHDAPSVLDRFTYGKEMYIAFIREALLEAVQDGNVIYHGLAGHFILKDVPHIMRVRIIANLEDRVKEEMKREGISGDAARKILKKDDAERRKWSLQLYGIDTADASLYDFVLHIDKLKVDDAVELLVDAAGRPCFQPGPESRRIIDDMVLAAGAEAALISKFPSARVVCKEGTAYVTIEAPMRREKAVAKQAKDLVKSVKGIKKVKVNVMPIITYYE
ncbi:MAG: cytidylate kinase-like family protein [Pseudomonadota bacterium]